MKRHIAILGSTGSIGTQALDVIRQHPDLFEATVLTAGSNASLLVKQAREFIPSSVVIANTALYDNVQESLADLPIKVYTGADALCEVVRQADIDMVLTAMVGFAGLRPTISAIRAHKAIALANKETLVVAGSIIRTLCESEHVAILPVDSEHSAIFQCLNGETNNAIRRILLTASGGPFRKFSKEQLTHVTPEQALCHPNWKMGAKITIDSASMMNKGFEMIEAHWLYNVAPSNIEVVVHPESILHSAIEFDDGAIIGQMGMPDMRLPIQYAFSYPMRLPLQTQRLDLTALGKLTFEKPDLDKFPCLSLSYEAIKQGGNMPCILNAAGEIANEAFRNHRLGFMDMPELVEKVMARATFLPSPTLDDLFSTDAESREMAKNLIN